MTAVYNVFPTMRKVEQLSGSMRCAVPVVQSYCQKELDVPRCVKYSCSPENWIFVIVASAVYER